MAINNPWHKGSRFWVVGTLIVCLVLLIGTGVLFWREAYSAEAMSMIGWVVVTFLGGAGAKSGVNSYRANREQPFPEGPDD